MDLPDGLPIVMWFLATSHWRPLCAYRLSLHPCTGWPNNRYLEEELLGQWSHIRYVLVGAFIADRQKSCKVSAEVPYSPRPVSPAVNISHHQAVFVMTVKLTLVY